MKTCSLCGLECDNQYSFCPEDGATLIDTNATELLSAQALPAAGSGPALDPDSATIDGSTKETGLRVLYCPACAGEYPLTFSLCPVDGVRLSAQNPVASVAAPVRAIALKRDEAPAQPVEPQPSIQEEAFPKLAEPAHRTRVTTSLEREEPAPRVYGSTATLFNYDSPGDVHSAPARRRFNRINLILLAALALVTVAAVYAINRGSRDAVRQVAQSNQPAGEAQEKPSIFIETPQTAADYSEPVEPASPDQPAEDKSDEVNFAEYRSEPTRPYSLSKPRAQRESKEKSHAQASPQERPIEQTRPRQVAASNQPQPQIVQVVDRRVNANLIRVRSRRTSSGYRYDLTFTLHDPAGRSFYWEKLLVTTRSASGLVRNQTIAFGHRQGANGLLTFTVGVDLNGATESDWRGSVICTSLGTDGPGKIIRAGFTANLAPW